AALGFGERGLERPEQHQRGWRLGLCHREAHGPESARDRHAHGAVAFEHARAARELVATLLPRLVRIERNADVARALRHAREMVADAVRASAVRAPRLEEPLSEQEAAIERRDPRLRDVDETAVEIADRFQ